MQGKLAILLLPDLPLTQPSVAAARGLLYSAVASGILGFLATILFLFCVPDLETLFGLAAPQPFVLMYAMALGKGPSVFMTILAVIGLILVRLSLSFSAM
jgi:translation initiation factor 5B